jgi:hypothetical protein
MDEAARRLVGWMLAVAVGGASAAACGGKVVVDGAVGVGGGTSSGITTASGSPNGAGGAIPVTNGTGAGGAGSGIQTPTNGGAGCQTDYYTMIQSLDDALGCTPTAEGLVQCTGQIQLHDPCGCLHVVNHAPPNFEMGADALWTQCVSDGCCGGNVNAGCSPCPPPPTSGACDTVTSHCVGN